jgi:hypothetical protein
MDGLSTQVELSGNSTTAVGETETAETDAADMSDATTLPETGATATTTFEPAVTE